MPLHGKAFKQAKRQALEAQPKLLEAIKELDGKRKDSIFIFLCLFLENGGRLEVSPEWYESAMQVAAKGLPVPVIEQKNGLTIDFKHDVLKDCLPDLDEEKNFRNHLKRAQAELERAFKLCGKLGLPDTEAAIVEAFNRVLDTNICYGREVPCIPYEQSISIGLASQPQPPSPVKP